MAVGESGSLILPISFINREVMAALLGPRKAARRGVFGKMLNRDLSNVFAAGWIL